MPIERTTRTPLIQPVSAIADISPGNGDTREQSERMRPVHIALAQEEGIAGLQRLAAMAHEPLPLNVADALRRHRQEQAGSGAPAEFKKSATPDDSGTRATISPEGRALLAAEQSGEAVVTEVGPLPKSTTLYTDVSALVPKAFK